MLREIKLDKICISISLSNNKDFLNNLYELIEDVRSYFEKVSCRKHYKYYVIEFTPTKYDSKHNLEQLEEPLLLAVLNKFNIDTYIIVTKFHLAFDIEIKKPFDEYISTLTSIKAKKDYYPVLFKSKKGSSVYFAHMDNGNGYSKNSLIKFYDKTAELKNKGIDISRIKVRRDYSDSVISKAYNSVDKIVNLEYINLMRIELAYQNTQTLKSQKKFKFKEIQDIISSLQLNTFYQECTEFMLTELNEILFYEQPDFKQEKTNYLDCILSNHIESVDIHFLKQVMIAADYSDSEINSTLNSISSLKLRSDEYYKELYQIIQEEYQSCKNIISVEDLIDEKSDLTYSTETIVDFNDDFIYQDSLLDNIINF